MGSLMYGSAEAQKGDVSAPRGARSPRRSGKTSRKLKAALGYGRGKARGDKKENPQTGPSLKERARTLSASQPKNESERELQELAARWLGNKRCACTPEGRGG